MYPCQTTKNLISDRLHSSKEINIEVYVDRNAIYPYLPQEVSEDSPTCQNIQSFSETLLQVTEHDVSL